MHSCGYTLGWIRYRVMLTISVWTSFNLRIVDFKNYFFFFQMAWLGRFDDFSFGPTSHISPKLGKTLGQDGGRPMFDKKVYTTKGSSRTGYTQICEISNTINHVSIIGLIIAKDGPKSIISKKGTERHLVSFTVRDSEVAFVNLTCWGGEQYVKMIACELHISDVVDVKDAQVQIKSSNPADEKFRPWTPSSCQLTVGENQGTIVPYSGLDIEDYTHLIHTPTRPSNDFYTLEDIIANGMSLQGEHINILAVVKRIWPPKKITMKTGKTTSKVDIVLCDETCMSFNLTLWDNYVLLAESWTPMETVLFAADVRITYNDYRSSMTASTDSKTIFTINPDTPEAACIREYSKTQISFLTFESEGNSVADGKDPPLETITNILCVRDVRNLLEQGSEIGFGLMYAFLSQFDIDSDEKMFCREVCPKCGKFVQESNGFICVNSSCEGEDLRLDGVPHIEYSLTVSLSDHTGTLDHCFIPANIAQHLLGAKANDFRDLNGQRKTDIKWSFLLERVKTVVKIRGQSNVNGRSMVKILSLEMPNIEELALCVS
ncbi:hypothetical protein RRG08_031719 [Elysia crispata]|uniref:Replication protein A OB domain-containing protein n=1 Tax=Elysia crispata TaxID=231223 RepID=A0AAE1DFQ2_9GAST|nr:hypothetical protein RRG08_031719 [Elysia crispata]